MTRRWPSRILRLVVLTSIAFLSLMPAGCMVSDAHGVTAPPWEIEGPYFDDREQLYATFEQIYVDNSAANTADTNSGRPDAPLTTLNEALRRADEYRGRGLATRINVHPGTFRESLTGTYTRDGPLVVVEALEPGSVVVSGSDLWFGWECDGSVCSAPWPHQWGFAANPWPDFPILPLGLRREMVFVDGVPLEQTSSLSATGSTPGSFFVDEDGSQLHVHPPSGKDVFVSDVEVAVRPRLLELQGLDGLVVAGVAFRHASTPVGQAAVYIVNQRNVEFHRVSVEHNNWDGVALNADNVTIMNSTFNFNGASGLGAYRSTGVLVEDSETSYNNWRGLAGDYTDWSVGQKFMLVRDLVIRGHTSTHNAARGLWLDADVSDVTIENARLCNNLRDGLFVELTQGPVVVRDSMLCDNGHAGLLTSSTHFLFVEDSVLENNRVAQVLISGDLNRLLFDFQTGETLVLNNESWSLDRNRLVSSDDQFLVSTTLPESDWLHLMGTSSFQRNEYSSARPDGFRTPGGIAIEFVEWRSRTGQDTSSTFFHSGTSP